MGKSVNGVAPSKGSSSSETEIPWITKLLFVLAALLGSTALVVGSLALAKENNRSSNSQGTGALDDSTNSSAANTTALQSRLDEVYNRGFLRCGYFLLHPGFLFVTGTDDTTGATLYAGLEYQLCRILSAAIFDGDSEAFELVQTSTLDRWTTLAAGEVDVFFRTAHTMGRDVYEPAAQTGFEFSSPYLFDPVTFGGVEEHVKCAEDFLSVNDTDVCDGLQICIWEGTVFYELMVRLFPPENLVHVPATGNPFLVIREGGCNVIVGIQSHLTEDSFRLFGYEGPAFGGTKAFGVERHAIVTRQGDPTWSDFVEVVLQTLIAAEEKGISQTQASDLPTTDLFGPRFERMFQNTIAVSGNYGEVYVDNVEAFLPRTRLNRLNTGVEPRLLPISLGNLEAEGPQIEILSPTVQAIREKGYLTCGQVLLSGFSEFDVATQTFSGFHVDLCRAISAALFDGVDRTFFETALPTTRLLDLNAGKYDLMFSASWTMPRDVGDDSVGNKGLAFAGPFIYLGIGFGGKQPFVDCAERFDVFSPECQDLRVCSIENTRFIDLFSDTLRDHFAVPTENYVDMISALRDGRCNAILSSAFHIQEPAVRAAGYGTDLPYEVGTRQFSIEPLSIVMRQDDMVWNDFVRWIFQSLVYAEAQGIGQANATLMPRTNLFGPLRTKALYHAVNMAGNYGEIYERNLGLFLPRSGVHLLNDFSQPRLYAFPGLI